MLLGKLLVRSASGGANLTGPGFLDRKDAIVAALRDEIEHGDLERMARMRAMKRSL